MRGALAMLALAACGGGGTSAPDAIAIDAAPREVIRENVPLAVNEIIEAKLVGGKGDVARIILKTDTPSLDWNIHGHANGGTQVIGEGFKQMSVDFNFEIQSQADWYLLLRNKGQTDINVMLEIELHGNVTWSGWI